MIEYYLDSPYNYLENKYLKTFCYECGTLSYIENGFTHDEGHEHDKFFCCELCLEAYVIQKEIQDEENEIRRQEFRKIKATSISS